MTLAGQVALVTGSSQRLGRVIALAYAREGAKVVINGATNRAALDQTVADARALGVLAIGCLADVRDRAAVDAMVAQASQELGPIDILVNYAGDEGGIVCDVTPSRGAKEVFIVSLTHLRIAPYHQLFPAVVAYQRERVRRLAAADV